VTDSEMSDRTVWRLIVDPEPLCGEWNMAVDEALLRSRIAGGPPTLRLYAWARPTVSLGRFQSAQEVDASACSRLGVDIVRRPTGGRAVLHDDEVTYSVAAAAADGLPVGIAASYRYLGAGLRLAYRRVGVDAEICGLRPGKPRTAACYLSATQADLAFRGLKLSGSAQVWRGSACLQHGSFVISRDAHLEAELFLLDDVSAAELSSRAVTISEALGRRPDRNEIRAAVVEGFSAALGATLVRGVLTEEEARDVAALAGKREAGDPDGPA
jgi:lipoate-protein ligase A